MLFSLGAGVFNLISSLMVLRTQSCLGALHTRPSLVSKTKAGTQGGFPFWNEELRIGTFISSVETLVQQVSFIALAVVVDMMTMKIARPARMEYRWNCMLLVL